MILYEIELFKPDESGDSYFESVEGYTTYELAFNRFKELRSGRYPVRVVKTEVLCEYFEGDEFVKED